jgi:hypothetical protein
MPSYALGRQPADPTKPKLRLRRSVTEPVTPPNSCDWLSEVREWAMLKNDSVGDCTMAGAAHIAVAVDRYGQGRDLTIGDDQVLAAYTAVSGYNPADPNTDVGATLQDALDYWRRTGIAGNTIAAFAFIDAQDLDLVRACIATFGAVYTGLSVPQSAMDQLDRGEPWTVAGRSRILGGHCVPIGAYDPDTFTCVTWGQTQRMDVGFYQRYFDEVAVPIDLDWMRANGTSPAGLDVAALNADYERLTGKPGPFPNVAPAPTPAPSTDPDRDLLAAFTRWQRRHRTRDLTAAFDAWRPTKGL